MPPATVIVVIALLVAVALVYGYRTLTALLVLRSLPAGDGDGRPAILDGESIALTGELVVEEPVPTGDAAVDDADRAVGAYLWRARFPDNTNSDLTIEEWGWERQHWHTFASGIEWGQFGVAAGGQVLRIDPSWLRETSGSEPLEALTVGGITNSETLSPYLWDRYDTYLRNRTDHRSLRRFAGRVQRHNDGVDLDRYLLETRPLLDGTTVSVSGVCRVEQGDPVLRGTDETPLRLSDQGFDGHRRWVRRRALRTGTTAVGLLAVAIGLWFEFYVPLAALIAGLVVYAIYHSLQDVSVFLEFLRWLRN